MPQPAAVDAPLAERVKAQAGTAAKSAMEFETSLETMHAAMRKLDAASADALWRLFGDIKSRMARATDDTLTLARVAQATKASK